MAQVNAGRVRFVGRGEYNNSTQYYVFDLVSYNGNSYYAKVDTIGHLPTDTTYWQLVAEKGNVGPTGLTGNGISSIEKTSTSGLVDTYTITYTNGNTTTFDVSNGNGIDRIEKTATVGNKDTYTIYFTNGSTTTYEVANGEVTREELEEEVERLSMIYNALPTTTGEVEEASINGTAEVPFKEIGLKGNTSQESTTGANQIGLKPVSSTTLNGLTYSVEGDILSINGTANAKTDMQKMLFNLTSTTSKTLRFYLVSGTFTNGNIGVHLNEYESSGQVSFIQIPYNTTDLKSTKIIDLTNVNYVWVYATSGSVFTNAKFRIMLSDNASDTYEPYTGGNPAPSPDYPYPVNVVTGDNEVKFEGKNIFDLDWFTFRTNNGITATKGDGYVLLNGTATATAFINYAIPRSLGDSNTNTWFIKSDYTDVLLKVQRRGYNDINIQSTAGTTIKQNIGNDSSYVYSGYLQIKNGTTLTNCKVYIDVRKDDVSLQDYVFEPYQSQTYPINLGSMELCKIGDYQDYLYKENGIWCKYGAIGKYTFGNETINWTSGGTVGNNYYFYTQQFDGLYNGESFLCDKLITNVNASTKENVIRFTSSWSNIRIYISTNLIENTITSLNNWLANNKPIIYIPLTTPTITEITDTTLIEQLDNLEKAYSYDTQTNISQTNQDKPFIISYEAILSLRNVLNS